MNWQLRIANRARKALAKKLPVKDQRLVMAALDAMRSDPFSGDIVRLHGGERAAWRRRVGNYRIFFDAHPDQLIVDVVEIVRRTSGTY